MGRKHCGKGQIDRYEQFLLCPQCFQNACFPGASKGDFVWEWVNKMIATSIYNIWFNTQFMAFCTLKLHYSILPGALMHHHNIT